MLEEIKEFDKKLRIKEDKYLENFRGSTVEKQRDEIKKDYEILRDMAKRCGINVNKWNWRDDLYE